MTVKELVTKAVNIRYDDFIRFNIKDKIIDCISVYDIIFDDMKISKRNVERFYINPVTGRHIIWIE